MAHVVQPLDQPSNYKDSQARMDRNRQEEALSKSSTLYVCQSLRKFTFRRLTTGQIGNLSFYTTEEQIYELFNKCSNSSEGGGIKRVIMGLDRNTKWVSIGPAILDCANATSQGHHADSASSNFTRVLRPLRVCATSAERNLTSE